MPVFYFLLVAFCKITLIHGELWEKDVSSDMKIGLSTTGYKSVDLRCDPNHFSVNVTLEDDFQGIVYTRGSFNDKKPPCFKRHDQNFFRGDNRLQIGLRIPFDKCRTLMDVAESRYTNVLVVQHDPDLIMPGDAAFSLDCAFVPEFKDETIVSTELNFKSKITLVDADPSAKVDVDKVSYTVSSKSEKVSFTPNLGESKDEL